MPLAQWSWISMDFFCRQTGSGSYWLIIENPRLRLTKSIEIQGKYILPKTRSLTRHDKKVILDFNGILRPTNWIIFLLTCKRRSKTTLGQIHGNPRSWKVKIFCKKNSFFKESVCRIIIHEKYRVLNRNASFECFMRHNTTPSFCKMPYMLLLACSTWRAQACIIVVFKAHKPRREIALREKDALLSLALSLVLGRFSPLHSHSVAKNPHFFQLSTFLFSVQILWMKAQCVFALIHTHTWSHLTF